MIMRKGVGEKIGSILEKGSPRSITTEGFSRYHAGQELLQIIMTSVVMGAGYKGIEKIHNEDAGIIEVYTRPPLTDKKEARRIGQIITSQYDKATKAIPDRDEPLLAYELNTFIHASTKPRARN